MADLFGLLHDLGERLASNGDSSCSTQPDEEDPVEARFRSVIPNLLHSYFRPQKVKEREFTAILKLLCHTLKNYPGVFYRGKAFAVLPVFGYLFPFLVHPAVSGRLGLLFETIGALVSLLKNGDREAYRHICWGAILLLEDLVSMVPFLLSSTVSSRKSRVCLKCFCEAYALLVRDTNRLFCELPSCWRAEDGPGLLLELNSDVRWQPLAEWTMKLLERILAEGMLHVEGLFTSSFISAIGRMTCFGDSSLQKACFELLSKLIPMVDIEMIPIERLVLTMTTIISVKECSTAFRNAAYDSALASCLSAVITLLHRETIEMIAHHILQVIPESILYTDSPELKIVLCGAYELILKYCPPSIWGINKFLRLISVSDICPQVSRCLDYVVRALDILKLDSEVIESTSADMLSDQNKIPSDNELQESHASGKKRRCEHSLDIKAKRQKYGQSEPFVSVNMLFELFYPYDVHEHLEESSCTRLSEIEELKSTHSYVLHQQLLGTMEALKQIDCQINGFKVDSRLSAFQVLACVFSFYPSSKYYRKLIELLEVWIPWVNSEAQNGILTVAQILLFLVGVEKLLNSDVDKSFQRLDVLKKLQDLLQLLWSAPLNAQREEIQKAKCCAIKIFCILESKYDVAEIKQLYMHAVNDEDAVIQSKMIGSLINTAMFSGEEISELFKIFRTMCMDKSSQVREAVAQALGSMACKDRGEAPFTGEVDVDHGNSGRSCVQCPLCGLWDSNHIGLWDNFHVDLWQHLCKYLLFEETSQKVQVMFVTSMSAILTHSRQINISKMKQELLKCLDLLPLHSHKAVRRAFSIQVNCFFYPHVLDGLFDDDGHDNDNTSKELQVLGKFKHALLHTEDPDLLESLVEVIAAVVLAASDRKQLFFFSFVLLLEQLDSKYASVQATSVSMIQKCLSVCSKDRGSGKVKLMVDVIQSELFVYLSGRLITRPLIVQTYADAVLGLQMEDIIRQIVPVVLPKLVIQQQHTDDALKVLHSLSNYLETELPLLLLEWCHKVLSVLLLKADGKDLMAALQFYESQTGSDTREIFTAVLPVLLDELVQFLGDTSNEEAVRRSARVPLMIQEVACIVSGSDELPGFLKTHFVGLLNSVDRKMLKSGDIEMRKQGLRCIDQLIEMIGSYLSAFIPKIMVLLTRAVQEPKLQIEALEVWLSFARRLASVCPANLKSVASQIVVAVMPCLEQPKELSQNVLDLVVKLLEELLVTNRNILDDHAAELPLLPSLPELTNVNSVLQQARGVNTLCGQLRRASEGIRHENISVRLMASSELKKLISSRRNDVMSMMLGESSSDAGVISDLILSLLQGCVEESRSLTSEKFKLVCAECLGELGAVDPVKLNLKLHVRSKIERTDDDLIFELIDKHLVRVLRAATETDIQDSAALAIQELLKLSGCREAILGSSHDQFLSKHTATHMHEKMSDKKDRNSSLAERGEKLWSRFSEDVKDIITPCLTSKYLLKNANGPSLSGTVFSPGLSFRRWMYLWVRRLVLLSTGPRALIFNACKGILRHDMSTVLYLLPYIVLNVVCDGTVEARASVTDEILSVLAEAASTVNVATCVKNHGEIAPTSESRSLSGPSEVSIQAVFTLLDNLAQWLDETKKDIQIQTETLGTQKGQRNNVKSRKNYHNTHTQVMSQHAHVSQLLEAIPKTALAGASFRCQAYARALLYFETHVRAKSGALNPAAERTISFEDDDISFLLGIYSGLDEPDGLSGLSRLHKSLSLQDEVLINEKAGNWAEALTCCEQALQMDPRSVSRHEGVLNCLLNMGHLQAMVTHVDGLLHRFPENKKKWSMWGVQAAWRLGQWELLGEYVHGAAGEDNQTHSTNAFDISLAKVLLAMQRKDNHAFSKCMIQFRHELLAPIAAASMESYSRAYPFIIKLHMLHELEHFQELFVTEGINGTHIRSNMQEMVHSWEARMKVTQPSLWAREPILALHRLILTRSNLCLESGNCWLQYAKLCRVAGHYETARRAILEAQSAGARNAHIELAKLLWDTKKSHRAIAELQQALAKASVCVLGAVQTAALGGLLHIPSGSSTVVQESDTNDNLDVAKTLLLLARWVHSTGQKQKEDVLCMYTRVKELQPKWEKSYFYLARYCDDLLADAKKRQEESQGQYPDRTLKQQSLSMATNKVDEKPWWSLLPEVILYYAKGLHQGHRHLFQALPRLLTLWFEFGSNYHGEKLSSNAAVKAIHARVMNIMWNCTNDLPSYQWLTTLPQLVSRICHQNEEVLRLVKHIITCVLQAYPQQALWMMAAVSKSTVSARHSAAAEILRVAKNGLKQQSDKGLFNTFASLTDQLINLCFHQASPRARMLSLSNEFSCLKRMMPIGIIMPVQQALTVTLPANGLTNTKYNPFASGDYSTISGIGEEVEILASLQRPKKVIFHGSDGKEYPFLCKPKDDLRKDSRMMEFTTTINRLLSKDPRSRRRKLYIRTFAVIPLTEDCGMVEWVLHTRGLRHILQDIYISLGKFDRQKTNLMIKKIYDDNKAKVSEVEMFQSQILPMFPPVFHKWFLNTFFEPESWFQSRIAYAHTTAVWSMVGHIVGLGDRHGENILFDSTTGDCVHVDFSCLFDKGLQLEKPELVPFRLTQNMVDGLGITGYEGVFSRVCEITLSVLRANRETLMTVLETFIHDPLVEWTKSHKSSGIEVKNPHAQRAIANIKARLQGVVVGVGAAPSLPLSVEGQANQLIAEAVSHENLARMYIWLLLCFLGSMDCRKRCSVTNQESFLQILRYVEKIEGRALTQNLSWRCRQIRTMSSILLSLRGANVAEHAGDLKIDTACCVAEHAGDLKIDIPVTSTDS